MPRAEQLVRAARASGHKMGVVLQHRFRPASLRLRSAIESGELGTITAAWMLVPWWRPQAYYDEPGRGTMARDGGGVLMTQAIHTLDLFRSLVGVQSVVAAQATTTATHKMETEDFASALVRLGNGAPGTIIATTAAYPGSPERIEITGTAGTASLVGSSLRLSYIDGREENLAAEGSTGSGANIMDFPNDAHRAVLADYLDAIEQDRDPTVTGEEALATQRLIADILAARTLALTPASTPANPQPPTHHLLQIRPLQPRQFLGEERHTLPVTTRHPRDIRPPEETIRSKRIKNPLQPILDIPNGYASAENQAPPSP